MFRILLLEDDLATLSKLVEQLQVLEDQLNKQISVTVMSEYWQVEDYLNISTKEKFDLILLDRDCKAGGSFHVLDLAKFQEATIIGISSVPEYNQQLKERGIELVITKDYQDLGPFLAEVKEIMEKVMM
jgi:CheY-like chemotaxis protein